MFILMLLMSLSVFAGTKSQNAYDQTYPRDNTYCTYKEQRLQVMIRGMSKFTEPNEKGYGEYVFYRVEDEKAFLLPISEDSDTFRLFHGTGPMCSKSHGYMINSSLLAVLLQKENKPFHDKLVIQLFDIKTFKPLKAIETEYPVQSARKSATGFMFKTLHEMHNPEMGKVILHGEEFIFHEKDFPYWVNYSSAGFEVLPSVTFKKSKWKKFFKDEADFLSFAGWKTETKKFTNEIAIEAVNHKVKKKCLLFIEAKSKVKGSEPWRCQAM